jgi:hypothetical protein
MSQSRHTYLTNHSGLFEGCGTGGARAPGRRVAFVWERFRRPRGGPESHPRNRALAPAGALQACGEGDVSMLCVMYTTTRFPVLGNATGRPDPGVEQMVAYVQVQVVM